MNSNASEHIDLLCKRYSALVPCRHDIENAVNILADSFRNSGKLLICGNGGSASDALHIVGELMKDFKHPRNLPQSDIDKIQAACSHADYLCSNLQGALPAIALVSETALQTAFSNDRASDLSFAQQVYGYGCPNDVLLGISTSGNSANVLYACETAHAFGLKTIVLTGRDGGKLKDIADCAIKVPETETYKIQELHLPVYHAICLALEDEFF